MNTELLIKHLNNQIEALQFYLKDAREKITKLECANAALNEIGIDYANRNAELLRKNSTLKPLPVNSKGETLDQATSRADVNYGLWQKKITEWRSENERADRLSANVDFTNDKYFKKCDEIDSLKSEFERFKVEVKKHHAGMHKALWGE